MTHRHDKTHRHILALILVALGAANGQAAQRRGARAAQHGLPGYLTRSIGRVPVRRLLPLLREAHPESGSALYHDLEHSVRVAKTAHDIAVSRGHSKKVADFITQVALLHDVDPERQGGNPARVPATLERMRADFANKKALFKGYKGRSFLREQFKWNEQDVKVAEALIQRTEYPQIAHLSPVYEGTSPREVYDKMLRSLSVPARMFARTEGPILSEFADKMSWYIAPFKRSLRASDGLVNEINNVSGGAAQMTAAKLNTPIFLDAIGAKGWDKADRELAKERGEDALALPSRDQIFELSALKLLKSRYGATQAGFQTYTDALAQGQPAQLATRRANEAYRRALRQ